MPFVAACVNIPDEIRTVVSKYASSAIGYIPPTVEELVASIRRFIEQYNLTAKPFKWTYKGIPLTA